MINNGPDWLDVVLVDAICGRPGTEDDPWPENARKIYYTRRYQEQRIIDVKRAIEDHTGDALTLECLRAQIRTMTGKSAMYKLLKEELVRRGWWKNRSRGLPSVAHFKKIA